MLRKTVVGVLLSVLLLVAAGCGGQDAAITQERLDAARDGLRTMVEETDAGRVGAGEDAFWKVDPFFHDVDPILRKTDWPLAVAMWNSMLQIEMQYAGDYDRDVLLEEGRAALQMLPQVAEALGLEANG